MEKRYWVFNFFISVIAGSIAGFGNLEVSIYAGIASFVLACIVVATVLYIAAGRIFTQEVLIAAILAVSIIAWISSMTIYEVLRSLLMAPVCVYLCLIPMLFFLLAYGNERIPVVGG